MEMDEATRRRRRVPTVDLTTAELKPSRARKVVQVASVGVYVVALCLPAVFARGDDPIGLVMLISGPFGFSIGEYRWIANIFYFVGLGLAGHRRKLRIAALICLLVGVGLSVSCIVIPPRIVVGGASITEITAHLSIGGYLWILAQAIALALPFLPSKPAALGQRKV